MTVIAVVMIAVIASMQYLIALIVVVLDQYTKALAVKKLSNGTIPVIKNIFHFTYVENTGAAFGIFKNSNTAFIIITSIILIGVIIALVKMKPKNKLIIVSTGLVIGGALGNLIDRILRGFVVDFLDFRAINYPVFNVADSCVVVGAILICVYLIFFDKKEETQNADV